MPDAEELKGARFVRSEKTCRLYMIPARAVLKADYLNVDETTVTVVDEERRHARKEYM